MKNWSWKLYGFFLGILAFSGLRDMFATNSAWQIYYTILIAFNKFYLAFFIFNIINLVLNVLAVLLVLCFAFNIKSSVKFWQILFFIRIIFDLIGHHFDMQFIKSAFFQSNYYGFASIGFLLLPYLPSYVAHYIYAFKRPAEET